MLNPGQILEEKYQVIKILGRGGMGTVYLCKNNRLGNLWAIKEVNSKWRNQMNFLAEPNMLKNLKHIGIVRIIDIFYEHDNLYIVEDYIEGNTLKEYIDDNGSLSSELVVDISVQLCSILDYLHSFNPPIIYRDLKPSNIMITPHNKVVLIDFGIARVYKQGQEGDTMVLGSRGYIAPEQLMNSQSNAKTDIYSLGSTMFFMLTAKSISLSVDPMSKESYPMNANESLVKIIQKASAARPENRYNNVRLMMSELSTIITDKEYGKTMVMESYKCSTGDYKTIRVGNKKYSRRFKLTIISIFVCAIILLIFLTLLMSNRESNKKSLNSSTVPKTSVQTELKNDLDKVDERPREDQKKQEEKSGEELKKQEENQREGLNKAGKKQKKFWNKSMQKKSR